MAVDVAAMKAAFPEFNLASGGADALIGQKLVTANAMLDATIFASSAQFDEAVKYLTARLLALSPSGINARLSSKDGATIYDETYRAIVRGAVAGYRVP